MLWLNRALVSVFVGALSFQAGLWVAQSRPLPVSWGGLAAFFALALLFGVLAVVLFHFLRRVIEWSFLTGRFRPDHWQKPRR